MQVRALTVAGLLMAGAAGPFHSQPPRVVDPEGKPVSGAHVEVLERREPDGPLAAMFPSYAEGDTDSEGCLPMNLPNREGLLVFIDHPGFLPLARPQTAKGPGAPFVLQPGRTWRDRVQPADREIRNGQICASWKEDFAAWREARIWKRCGEISAKGELNLTGLPVGEVTLEAQASGFLLLRRTASLPLQKPLRLVPGVRVSGRITGPGPETPVAHAMVRSEGSSPAESREDGSFSIAVPRLPATLEVSAPGFRQRRVETGKELRKGGLAGSLLRGRVLDREGKPRSGLTVRVLDREGSSLLPLAERTTDPEGRFEGPRLAAGPYRLQVLGHRLLLDQEIEVPEGHRRMAAGPRGWRGPRRGCRHAVRRARPRRDPEPVVGPGPRSEPGQDPDLFTRHGGTVLVRAAGEPSLGDRAFRRDLRDG